MKAVDTENASSFHCLEVQRCYFGPDSWSLDRVLMFCTHAELCGTSCVGLDPWGPGSIRAWSTCGSELPVHFPQKRNVVCMSWYHLVNQTSYVGTIRNGSHQTVNVNAAVIQVLLPGEILFRRLKEVFAHILQLLCMQMCKRHSFYRVGGFSFLL